MAMPLRPPKLRIFCWVPSSRNETRSQRKLPCSEQPACQVSMLSVNSVAWEWQCGGDVPTSSLAHQGRLCTVGGVMQTACPQNAGRVWALKGAIR